MDETIFSGDFRFSEYNSHEVYDCVHLLHLIYKDGKYTGTLRNYNSHGNEIWSDSTNSVTGEFNSESNLLELTISVPHLYDGKLLVKFDNENYYGNYISYGDRWDKWEKF